MGTKLTGIPRRTARLALALPVIAIIAACGTTVPQTTVLRSFGGSAAAGQSGGVAGDGVAGTGDAGVTADDAAAPVSTAGPGVAAAGTGSAGPVTGVAAGGGGATVPGSTSVPVAGQSAGPTTRQTTRSTTAKASASAAPGSTKGSGPSASKAPTGGSSSGSAPTTPIKIGFDYFTAASGAAANAAAGVSASTTLTPDGLFNGFVAYLNAHGGLGGRQIQVVPHTENDMSNNYATDAESACQYFTQDAPVPIVVDVAWGAGFGYNTCLTKAGIEDVSLPSAPDAASLTANPFEVHPGALTPDRSYSAALVQLVKAGTLKAGTKIGVFTDKCADTTAAYADTIAPTFKRLGLIPDVFTTDCIGGYGGLGAASADTSSSILQFRANGDTQVMMITANDPTYWILYGANAASQQYGTGFIMTSESQATAVAGNFTAGQKASIHGAGWVPILDVSSPKLPGTAVEATCDAMAAAAGQHPTSNNDEYSVYTLCAPLLVLKAALANDQANASAPALSKAISGLGTSFSVPGILGGVTDFSRQDAVADVQVFGYQTGCSCLAYSGSPTPA